MINFRKLRFKNFLSTGDNFTEIQLNKSPTTLIVGTNGAGKSTLLDALSFALFGKAHRNINKMQLINSINQKHAVCEVEFTIGKHEFLVRRGIKPTIFEVYQNGQLMNQESHAKDYQKQLEKNILKLNHKSFHQIVVLGSSNFIPFMQLPTYIRREVIEDLLDINIFSKMNTILKEENAKIREDLKDVGYQVELYKEKIDVQKSYISDLMKLSAKEIEKTQEKIREHKEEIAKITAENEKLQKQLDDNYETFEKDRASQNKSREELISKFSTINNEIKTMVKEAMFYDKHDSCPTCEQDIDEKYKKERQKTLKIQAEELAQAKAETNQKIKVLDKVIEDLNTCIEKTKRIQNAINSNNALIAQHVSQISRLEKDNEQGPSKEDIQNAQDILKAYMDDKDTYIERKIELTDKRTYNEVMAEMLKDTGIKTKIIKQYLPVMNKLINKYLQVLDFFVSFHIDENFEETIKSRHRDEFTYSSFSEGEKQRIDLALLFTWRQIAKMKNSVSTNLLVLDETFDSSLDVDGVENLMKILETLDASTNVFVISHKGDILESKFPETLRFVKENNFSTVA